MRFYDTGKSFLLLVLQFQAALNLLASDAQLSATKEVDRKISPSDTLIIEVFGEKELTVERRVEAGGSINYPLLGRVDVGGKTAADVAQILKRRLGEDFLVAPHVDVRVKDYRLSTVSVFGEVDKPGSIKLYSEVPMDILEAIAQAGGFKQTANKSRVQLTRNGKTQVHKFDKLRKITDSKKKVWLEPGDVIYIPMSFF